MQPQTRTIETPVGKHKVEIREWISGRQREYINEPMYSAVDTSTKVEGGKVNVGFPKVDVRQFITESEHREIETFVVSVDGKAEKVLDLVLDMNEEDTAFVKSEISKIAKKKGTQTT